MMEEKKLTDQQRQKQEAIDLAPAKALQPKSRNIRYDNMKSAMAEETLLAMALREPALLDQAVQLKGESFSSGLLGKVFSQLQQRHSLGLEVSVAVLEDMDAEEMSHIAGVAQKELGPVNEQAFADCIRTVLAEHQAASVSTEDDLIAYQKKLKERKGIKG